MDAAAARRQTGAMSDGAMKDDAGFEAARLTVRLGAITANWRTYRRLAGPCAVAAVVKADAYGLGAGRIAPSLAAAGCDSFFVARLEEGVALRALLPGARIFVLDGAEPDAVPALISQGLIPVLNSLAQVAAWSAAAGASRASLEAVLHVDTGMNRLGLPGDELAVLAAQARQRLAGLNLVLVMSHLACADEPDNKMNAQQLSRFKQALAMLPPAPASLAASHGAFLSPDYHFDLVRPGVALYGANPQSAGQNLMQAAAILTGKVLQVRRIDSGESVGYAASFRAKRPSMLATVALGYADGIPRSLSNQGFAALGGGRAPIVGRVSMDMLVLDVTDLPDVRPGDTAELLGDTMTLDEVARAAGTNAYEILTRLRRAPKHYQEASASAGVTKVNRP
ncbi:MAG TPA: alanine racemase [Rhizomicrobium sp.]|nr:alanine racemase [Rhizomicrobium sp.]